MATCGYEDIPAFHKAELMVAPSLQSEGKQLQREQEIGMGATAAAAAHPAADGVTNGSAGLDESRRPLRSGAGRRVSEAVASTRSAAAEPSALRPPPTRCSSSTSGASTRS